MGGEQCSSLYLIYMFSSCLGQTMNPSKYSGLFVCIFVGGLDFGIFRNYKFHSLLEKNCILLLLSSYFCILRLKILSGAVCSISLQVAEAGS